jgi:6-phosphogluconolactonase
MGNTIRIFKNIDDLSQFFAQLLAARIKEIPEGEFFSMALSGGSTPKLVFEYLASNFRDKIDWKKVLLFWSDERCVGPQSDESNYRMAKESLLDHIPVPAKNIFRIKGESDPDTETRRYSDVVRQNIPSYTNYPQFDFMMLGLGDDGHTASIFPGNLDLFKSRFLFEVAKHPLTGQKRITGTGNLTNQAHTVIFVVTGETKAEIIARIIEKKEGSEKLPASLVLPQNGELFWLLDDKAAKKLNMQDINNYDVVI